MLYDVKNEFNRTGSAFPVQAEDIVKERFQYRSEYAEMQRRQDEQKQIAEFIGSGQVYESLSDEILDELRRPEIMDINIEDLVTTKETVIPPDIVRYVRKETFLSRIANRFRSLFNR